MKTVDVCSVQRHVCGSIACIGNFNDTYQGMFVRQEILGAEGQPVFFPVITHHGFRMIARAELYAVLFKILRSVQDTIIQRDTKVKKRKIVDRPGHCRGIGPG